MDLYFIANKLCILIFISWSFINEQIYKLPGKSGSYSSQEKNYIFITILLAFVIINMLMYISGKNYLKFILLLISIGYCVLSAVFIFRLFILLLPIAFFELLYNRTRFLYIYIASILPILYVHEKSTYFICCTLSLLLLVISKLTSEKIKKLTEENEALKDKNYDLIYKMSKDMDYKEQLKYMSQLEERNKISQEIHDKIGHTLSSGIMQLQASKLLVDSDLNKSVKIIDNVIYILNTGMESIRATLRNIKPTAEQIGINNIQLLADEVLKNTQIKCNIICNSEDNMISGTIWKVIYDNVKECITNTLKYSKATRINISITILNKLIKVEVKDNGMGSTKYNKGMGIIGMEERMASEGGKIIVDGSNGFSVIMLFPIDK